MYVYFFYFQYNIFNSKNVAVAKENSSYEAWCSHVIFLKYGREILIISLMMNYAQNSLVSELFPVNYRPSHSTSITVMPTWWMV